MHSVLVRDTCTVHVLQSTNLFTIEPVQDLPKINSSVTLLSVLLGMRTDAAFNFRLIHWVSKHEVMLHLIFLLGAPSSSLLYMTNPFLRWSILCVTTLSFCITLVLPACVFSWHVVCLLLTTFEFWYLSLINFVFVVMQLLIFPDVPRRLFFIVAAMMCQFSFFLDATSYTRRYWVRTYTMAGVFLAAASVLLKVSSIPGINDVTINCMGLTLVAKDVAINSMMTLAIIMIVKVLPFRHLIIPGKALTTVHCELYSPSYHLVSTSLTNTTPKRLLPMIEAIQLNSNLLDDFGVIDTQDTVAKLSTLATMRVFIGSRVFDWFGYVGLLLSFGLYVWHTVFSCPSSALSRLQCILATIGLVTTIIYVLSSMMHSQRTLLRLLIREFDMWFVGIQWTLMVMSASDLFNWDARVLTFWSSWWWCIWMLSLDAFSPIVRRLFGYQSWFGRAVLVVLVVYPILLIYWIFYSGAANFSDNYIIHFKISTMEVTMTNSSFLASRIASVWLWLVRFLWSYSPHKFVFIKRRLQYSVITDFTSPR